MRRGLISWGLIFGLSLSNAEAVDASFYEKFVSEAKSQDARFSRTIVSLQSILPNRDEQFDNKEFRLWVFRSLSQFRALGWLDIVGHPGLQAVYTSIDALRSRVAKNLDEQNSFNDLVELYNRQNIRLYGKNGEHARLLLNDKQIRSFRVRNGTYDGQSGVCAGIDYVYFQILAGAQFDPSRPRDSDAELARQLVRALDREDVFTISGFSNLESFVSTMMETFNKDPKNPLRNAIVSAQSSQWMHQDWFDRKTYRGLDQNGEYAGSYFRSHRAQELTALMQELVDSGLPSHTSIEWKGEAGSHQVTLVGYRASQGATPSEFYFIDSNAPAKLSRLSAIPSDRRDLIKLVYNGEELKMLSIETSKASQQRHYEGRFKSRDIAF